MRTTADAQALKKSLGKSELVHLSQNPVDIVWGSERPQRPKNPIFPLDVKYSGLNASSSLSFLFRDLHQEKLYAVNSTVHDKSWSRRMQLR
jgi:Xaa-Pro aminopeptidase